MTKRLDYERRLAAELAAHGVHEYEIRNGGKHLKLCFRFNGEDLKFIYPASPSDRRGIQNALTDLRRMMGVKRIVKKNPDRQPKRRAAKLTLDCPAITTKPDPFAVLAATAEARTVGYAEKWLAQPEFKAALHRAEDRPSLWQRITSIFNRGA